ncbi:MAG: hypothetical protein Q7J12_00125 [Syntrophales bacterium]|uniref:hypothetical protein n=1 Tax=Candidatus Wunengus sp. YC61 TaxID=3367698 RepID=UPI00271D6583|nr:hypothetical protein [Syntrophales bacterium]
MGVKVQWKGKMVRIRYWRQDTAESGHFVLSGLMNQSIADRILKAQSYERAEIVYDSEGT